MVKTKRCKPCLLADTAQVFNVALEDGEAVKVDLEADGLLREAPEGFN